MKVILRQSVPQVGNKGDIVEVKPGYGRNFLIPKGLAQIVTPGVQRDAAILKKKADKQKKEFSEKADVIGEKLAGTENKISYSRQFYNDSVMKFNQAQQVFPANVLANMFGFSEKDYFEIDIPEHREPVKVEF